MSQEPLETDHERRACTRLLLAYAVELETEGGVTVHGTSRDISLGGLLIQSQDDLTPLRAGESSKVTLLLENGERTPPYRCVISRIHADSIGLALDRKAAAAFGMRLTKGMFSR